MKLATLFGLYLYQQKKLSLPGIGIFSIDPALAVPDAADKNFSDFLQHINYIQKPVPAADEKFIEFIRTHTGKIKPLAESDLDSFLSDAKILLNIGKPFYLEGVGSLQKNRAGQYEFTPGQPLLQRREHAAVADSPAETTRKQPLIREDILQNPANKKILVFAALGVAVLLAIWLGFSLYNSRSDDSTASSTGEDTGMAQAASPDSSALQAAATAVPASGVPAGSYKFTIERTSNKARAYRRFTQIRDNRSDVKLESNPDSTRLSLYFIIPSQASDTARIRDSLKTWYGRKQVFVEN